MKGLRQSITMTDTLEQQIMQIPSGNQAAFQAVYETTKSTVYGFAVSILRNRADAEDVMHDTYLKIYQSAASYQPMGKPLSWILTIVRNLSYNRIRDTRFSDDISEHTELFGKNGLGQVEERLFLDALLEILSEEERQIVMLHAMTGWKHREIAEWMDLPVSTVLSKYNRAIKKMQKELGGKGEPQ